MKDIKKYINEADYNIFADNTINESSIAPFLPLLMSQISMLMLATSAMYSSGSWSDYNPTILDTIKSWWKDKKAAKIIKRLALDNEVQEFLQQSPSKQQSGWRDLLKTKLDEKELEYIYRITKSKVADQIKK